MRLYLLRDFVQRMYLKDVTNDGLKATFHADMDSARQFTPEERTAFREWHDHITGRWVLLEAERKRNAASVQ